MKSNKHQIIKSICIYEDDGYLNLLPLTYTRASFELLCGAMTLAGRIRRFFPGAEISYQCRPVMAAILLEKDPHAVVNRPARKDCLFINGRVLMNAELAKTISASSGTTFLQNEETIAFWNSAADKKINVTATLIQYPWELVHQNGAKLCEDFKKGNQKSGVTKHGGRLINRAKIFIGKKSIVKIGAVLDADNGPILIGDNVTILSNAVVAGPCFIGDNTIIKAGAKIYGDTTIGPVCKVGGEVEGSIIQGFTNKQHDGFLGHSYIGEWCNLGADTNTSDLKNNYGNVKVTINEKEVDSGSKFVGLTMGDHSKSGINTMFNTGTVVGVASSIFGHGFPPKNIPSFAWCDSASLSEYRFEKALEVARIVMERRNVAMSSVYAALLQLIFEATADERFFSK